VFLEQAFDRFFQLRILVHEPASEGQLGDVSPDVGVALALGTPKGVNRPRPSVQQRRRARSWSPTAPQSPSEMLT
jgi:hypothetical protein